MKNRFDRLFRLQRILGFAYTILLTLMLVFNITAIYSKFGWGGLVNFKYVFVDYAIPVFLVLIACNLVVAHCNTRWARILHIATFFVQSYFILLDSIQDFYGWGMALIGLLLMYKYGFFNHSVIKKSILLYASFVFCCLCSILFNRQPLYEIVNVLVFSIFILLFATFIFKDEITEAARNRQHITELQEKVIILQESLEEQQESAITKEKDLIEQLSGHQQTESDGVPLRKQAVLSDLEKLTRERDELSTQQETLRNLEADIRQSISKLPALQSCTETELELIFLFYIHRGNLTNKEMASLMNLNCDAVKYRMRTIYHKIDGVDSRTGLLAYIDDNIQLKPY